MSLIDKKITALEKLRIKSHAEKFIQSADYEGVSPLLYKKIGARKELPYEVVEHLKRSYYTTLARNIIIAESLKEILRIFKSNGIQAILLKGLVLAELLYEDIGVRPICDIDLLIHKEDFPDCSRMLIKMGYTPSPTHPEGFSKGDIIVDLHWQLLNEIRLPSRKFVLTIDMEEVWRESITLNITGEEAKTLSLEHMLIYCAIHLLLHHGMYHTLFQLDLEKFLEIYARKLDWTKIIRTAKKWGTEKILYLCLSYLNKKNGLDIEKNLLKSLVPHPNLIDRWLLKIITKGEPYHELRHLFALFMIDGIKNKLKFLKELLLPPLNITSRVYKLQDKPLLSYVKHFINIFRAGYYLCVKSLL